MHESCAADVLGDIQKLELRDRKSDLVVQDFKVCGLRALENVLQLD